MCMCTCGCLARGEGLAGFKDKSLLDSIVVKNRGGAKPAVVDLDAAAASLLALIRACQAASGAAYLPTYSYC